MYQDFIGIDISKADFYVAFHGETEVKVYSNTETGHKQLYTDSAKKLKKGLVVLETTGGHELALTQYLQKQKCHVHRANTLKVKHFIRSFGQLGKSDAIDALALAHYGFERHPSLTLFIEPPEKELQKLVLRRADLVKMRAQEKNRIKAPDQKTLQESFERVINLISEEVDLIDKQIDALFEKSKTLQKKREVLKTLPGIGDVSSTQLIAMMPELGTINRKQIASLAGVAPHPNQSGKKDGYRATRGGRAEVKPVLFMAAMSASRGKSRLGDFYRKLVDSGKQKMVAMTALMRKILVIANARMKEFYEQNPSFST